MSYKESDNQPSETCSVHSHDSQRSKATFIDDTKEDLENNNQTIVIQKTATSKSNEPYSVYSGRKKWLIVIICCVTGLVSPLSANIYFPALDVIKRVRHTHTNKNLKND